MEELLIAYLPFAKHCVRVRNAENQPVHSGCSHSEEEMASQQMAQTHGGGRCLPEGGGCTRLWEQGGGPAAEPAAAPASCVGCAGLGKGSVTVGSGVGGWGKGVL